MGREMNFPLLVPFIFIYSYSSPFLGSARHCAFSVTKYYKIYNDSVGDFERNPLRGANSVILTAPTLSRNGIPYRFKHPKQRQDLILLPQNTVTKVPIIESHQSLTSKEKVG